MFEPRIVFFSSVTENTKRFVDKLGYPSERIGLKIKGDLLKVDYPHILITPTYKGGANTGAVPRQVINFLNDEQNRKYTVGVVAAGNVNFGVDFCISGDVISEKLNVPILHRFELMGTVNDEQIIHNGISQHWANLLEMRGLNNA